MTTKMPQTVSKEYIAETRQLFHCQIKIKIPISYGEKLLNQGFEILENIDKKYNSYQAGSQFDNINRQAGHWVKVDEHCIRMLETLKLVSTLTKGSYDITCMPLIRLWRHYWQIHNDIPSTDAIQKTLEKVDFRTIAIDGNQVKINPGQEIITGSFIKAFAVDQLVEFLKVKGVSDAIVNAGGSTIKAMNDETHPDWKINIPDAFVPGEYRDQIRLSNQCFSLSGVLNNNLIIKNKTYGHILNSRTGLPVSTAQVGIITQEAFLGDILSTALFTVTREEIGDTVEKLEKHFEFNYFRIEEDGNKTADKCF